MSAFTLIYDRSKEKEVKENLLPLLEDHVDVHIPLERQKKIQFEKGQKLITFLSDVDLAFLFSRIDKEKEISLALLPHPDMKQARQGFGIAAKIPDAVEDILEREKPLAVDLMYCNESPVFNTVIFGNSLSLVSGYSKTRKEKGLKRLWQIIKEFTRPVPFAVRFISGEKKNVYTAVTGIVAIQHGKSSLLSRRVLEDSFANDGKMHALILAPKSIFSLLFFFFRSLITADFRRKRLPDFVGHIKAAELTIQWDQPQDFVLDGRIMSAKEAVFVIRSRYFKLYPGRHLKVQNGDAEQSKESFRMDFLPRGDARDEMASKPLPWINHATTEEFRELFQVLRENARTRSSYVVLMTLSTILATFGIFADSSPVIIGAMILAPLMSPIISLSMGVLRQDNSLVISSSKTVGVGLLVGYLCAMLLTWFTPLHPENNEISSRINPNLLDLGIAVASGVAGAYAHAREEVAKTLAGVAIAVALVPPLAVSGIGLGWGNWAIFSGSFLLLLTNLTGMVLAGSLTFLLLGFSPFRLARKGIFLSAIFVMLISLPLFFGFSRIVRENKIVQSLDGWQTEQNVRLRDVKVRSTKPIRISVKLVAGKNLDRAEIMDVRRSIEDRLGEEVELEITFGLVVESGERD